MGFCRTLRQYNHEGQQYVEAPPEGDYQIRLTNDSPKRRLVVLSVDGVNVIDGATADFKGPGYCLTPGQQATIKGWRRSDTEVASFQFKPQEASYANQTGRGTANTGVIGVAVFDEKEKPIIHHIPWTPPVEVHHHHHHDYWGRPIGTRFTTTTTTSVDSRINERAATKGLDPSGNVLSSRGIDNGLQTEASFSNISDGGDLLGTLCSTADAMPMAASAGMAAASAMPEGAVPMGEQSLGGKKSRSKSAPRSAKAKSAPTPAMDTMEIELERGISAAAAAAPNLGTGYGERTYMYTSTTEFDRLENPSEVLTLRYAVRAKLTEWGVPVVTSPPPVEAFPASRPAVAPPPGWR